MTAFSHLTSRQREVFEFIREKITGRGYGPTVREIVHEGAMTANLRTDHRGLERQ